jgi:CheY-like chemotaxis protein
MLTVIPLRILIIEDDSADAQLFSELLREATRFNAIVSHASSCVEGREKLKTQNFDIVFLDYKLPDGDGLKFLSEARRMHYRTPFILITNYNDNELQANALEVGATEYLEKGKITAEVLERTCLYALSLHEKRVRNGGGPGVGPQIQTLVDLTRESVKSQTEVTTELRLLRESITSGFTSVNKNLDEHEESAEDRAEDITNEIHDITRFRWLLDWVATHPFVAILVVFLLCVLVCLFVYALTSIDTQKVKDLKEAAGASLTTVTYYLRC